MKLLANFKGLPALRPQPKASSSQKATLAPLPTGRSPKYRKTNVCHRQDKPGNSRKTQFKSLGPKENQSLREDQAVGQRLQQALWPLLAPGWRTAHSSRMESSNSVSRTLGQNKEAEAVFSA